MSSSTTSAHATAPASSLALLAGEKLERRLEDPAVMAELEQKVAAAQAQED